VDINHLIHTGDFVNFVYDIRRMYPCVQRVWVLCSPSCAISCCANTTAADKDRVASMFHIDRFLDDQMILHANGIINQSVLAEASQRSPLVEQPFHSLTSLRPC